MCFAVFLFSGIDFYDFSFFIADPHLTVIGFPDEVRAAKAKIMDVLDTKVD